MTMDERKRGGERAVSEVIGVILMVAIVVVMAAAVGTFVFGLEIFGFQTVPQAQFTVEFNEDATAVPVGDCTVSGDKNVAASNGVLNITHTGGQSIDVDSLSIVGAAASPKPWEECSSLSAEDEVSNRDSAHIAASSDDVVRLVWESQDAETSKTLVKWNGTAET